MFLAATRRRNPALLQTAQEFHRQGLIQPDTYVLDLDAILANAQVMKAAADRYGVKLYFMTKQLGRNPLIARSLSELGYAGAVAVDFREAALLAAQGIPLGHVGHLVQVPSALVPHVVRQRPQVMTVYSVAKAKEIDAAAAENRVQDLILRVTGEHDVLYPGQYGGFSLAELAETAAAISALPHVAITGVTSFPCFLYNEDSKQVEPTANIGTVLQAKELLQDMGIPVREVNLPSATCTAVIPDIARHGGTHGEPGHGLTGTTPLHAVSDQPEIPAVVYVSEISHTLGPDSYCYGGGHYRRSHMAHALVGRVRGGWEQTLASAPEPHSIDYHIRLEGRYDVGDTVLMAFRTQIFVTRSDVAVVAGIQSGQPRLAGIYDSLGRQREGWR